VSDETVVEVKDDLWDDFDPLTTEGDDVVDEFHESDVEGDLDE
jgi:hypothetical protein